eukprot:Skav208983  [mRNA]  locus=scaffold1270:224303:225530:- [translate_table: standard]
MPTARSYHLPRASTGGDRQGGHALLDKDGSNAVDFEEWQKAHAAHGRRVAHALLDKDGSNAVDFEEWQKAHAAHGRRATQSMGYFGPSEVIYRYLPGNPSGLPWLKAGQSTG